ncbi:hypothetical protein BDP27DRAFT_1404117 [Rhodocollybia butyracea]|uniref:NB-ARC domain-containing protein n=1 Tax=Rhodocollybia butyracea TaxID=206335 RepID=A0A9P5PRT4_9AGAR|nr:hypothetical protein BDP27DRAFT_1404117 [Rhodocollybia butyracea]
MGEIIALIGPGGSGKTQIALKTIAEITSGESNFCHKFFLDASTKEGLESIMKSIAQHLRIGGTVQGLKNWLSSCSHEAQWLLIFDNADDSALGLENYIPQNRAQGSVLITSQNSRLRTLVPRGFYQIGELEAQEAIKLLIETSHLEKTESNLLSAQDVVEKLGYLALAVSTAGSYILQSDCTLKVYLDRLEKNWTEIVNQKPSQVGGYNKTVWSIFQMSYFRLSGNAQLFLKLCSSLHWANIPIEIFSDAGENFEHETLLPDEEERVPHTAQSAWNFLRQYLTEGSWNSSKFQELLTEITGYSLVSIQREGTQSLRFHPLFHQCMKDMRENTSFPSAMMVDIFSRAIPTGDSQKDHQFRLAVHSHADAMWEEGISGTVYIQEKLRQIWHELGLFEKEYVLCNQISAERTRFQGRRHLDTLSSIANLAETYRDRGKYDEAEKYGKEVMEQRLQILKMEHPETLRSMVNLACTYSKKGEYEKARKLQLEAWELQSKSKDFGKEHLDTLFSMADLACTYRDLGQYEKAKELEMEVLRLRLKLLGEAHPDTLRSMANLAGTHSSLGQYEETKKLEVKVSDLRKKLLGKQHPDTLISMANLACTYGALEEHESAKGLGEEVLRLRVQLLGERHPETLHSMANLAWIYGYQGDHENAKMLGEEVLRLQSEILGREHPDTLVSMANLACICGELGEYKSAMDLEVQVLNLQTRLLGKKHPDTLHTMVYLACSYHNLQQYEKAKNLELDMLKLQSELLGEKHPDTLHTMATLACSYHELEQYEDARKLRRKALPVMSNVLGSTHPDTIAIKKNQYRQLTSVMFKRASKLLKAPFRHS